MACDPSPLRHGVFPVHTPRRSSYGVDDADSQQPPEEVQGALIFCTLVSSYGLGWVWFDVHLRCIVGKRGEERQQWRQPDGQGLQPVCLHHPAG